MVVPIRLLKNCLTFIDIILKHVFLHRLNLLPKSPYLVKRTQPLCGKLRFQLTNYFIFYINSLDLNTIDSSFLQLYIFLSGSDILEDCENIDIRPFQRLPLHRIRRAFQYFFKSGADCLRDPTARRLAAKIPRFFHHQRLEFSW